MVLSCPLMKIYSSLNIGSFHTNNCEDFLVYEDVGSDEKLSAVMDGCTMGDESVFASILIGKVLRKISKNFFYQDYLAPASQNLEEKLREIIRELFKQLTSLKNEIALETNELLSTLIIGVVSKSNQSGEFMAVGDGLIYSDGLIYEYEQDNVPDYLGYHLNEDFDQWYNNQVQRLSITHFNDLSICTDGIFSFKNFADKDDQKTESEVIDFLLKDNQWSESDNFLERKVRYLNDQLEHEVTDDLAIIRVKFN